MLDNVKKMFDEYTFKAHLQPALVTLLPFGVLLFVWMPGDSLPLGGLSGIIGTGGGTALMVQIARDRGRKKQPSLWERWRGPPTTRLLRFKDSPNRITLTRWRTRLERLVEHSLPTEEEERKAPAAADLHYEAATNFLRGATRDSSRYPLVFKENVNYGFRRNLWGLKPYGLTIAALAAAVAWALFLSSVGLPWAESWPESVLKDSDRTVMTRAVGSFFNTALMGVWTFLINSEWVRIPAEAYAQRLLESIDTLDAQTL